MKLLESEYYLQYGNWYETEIYNFAIYLQKQLGGNVLDVGGNIGLFMIPVGYFTNTYMLSNSLKFEISGRPISEDFCF